MRKFVRVLKIFGIVLGSLLVLAIAYVLYVFIDYHRLEDHLAVEVDAAKVGPVIQAITPGDELTAVSYNIGFGAYDPEFTFFMDGGRSSWAKSRDSVLGLVNGAGDLAMSFDPDFVLFQEIDFDSTRSYHIDQYELLRDKYADYDSVLGINYDSPFLFYPFYQPHGASRAGVGTFSRYGITACERRSLPISGGLSKFVDLDRCYTVSRVPVSNGKELILINVHMSAYGSSPEIREGQTEMLKEELEKEYEAGNYVIVGGDFNHDLKLAEDMETYSWAHYYDRSKIPEHFSFVIDFFSDKEKAKMPDTCRDAGVVYDPETTYTVTLDGFIVSDNVKVLSYENYEESFLYSDHDPVIMSFMLEG
ncbi:MAG: endonuclease/exonuclease/phosphatase family protein [Lachnospiraceae bacterium]|nr:endonuclease/exonuclease/phosphatase family protein [Lachnospiraceae bacterium]